jgi:hypothetical protein
MNDSKPFVHGFKLGREHRSVRRHLVEDHGKTEAEVAAMSDGALFGWHDLVAHGIFCADQYDVPHPGDNPFMYHKDLWRVPRSKL